MSRKIGDIVDGSLFGLTGYKLKITGGSDSSGFPMDRSIQGTLKTRAYVKAGESGKRKGLYERRTVRGNTIAPGMAQVNAVIVEQGEKPIDELFPKAEKKEEKKEEKK